MKALVYHGPGNKAWEEVPKPTILRDTDAIVRGLVQAPASPAQIAQAPIPPVRVSQAPAKSE